jgi:ribulose-5-phosphate 4-epimerase/fuculose-1-phosphate aldolase
VGHQQERVELAAGLRWAARLGMQEGVDNHFTLAVRDRRESAPGDVFLVNPWGLHWSEVTASSLLLCDAFGTVLEGDGEVEPTALHIHSPIHLSKPDAPAVLHTHLPNITAISVIDSGRLQMCQQTACMFWNNISYDDEYSGLALDRREGERIATKVGQAATLVLGGHGAITLGVTVAESLAFMYYLEQASRVQLLASAAGAPLRVFEDALLTSVADQLKAQFSMIANSYFDFVLRTLRSEEPGFAS